MIKRRFNGILYETLHALPTTVENLVKFIRCLILTLKHVGMWNSNRHRGLMRSGFHKKKQKTVVVLVDFVNYRWISDWVFQMYFVDWAALKWKGNGSKHWTVTSLFNDTISWYHGDSFADINYYLCI